MGFLANPIQAILVLIIAILLAALAVQTVRIDGFPLFYDGLRLQLAECRNAQLEANRAAQVAQDKAREDGRIAAEADADRLRQERDQARAAREKDVSDLNKVVANLRRRSPSIVVSKSSPQVTVPAVEVPTAPSVEEPLSACLLNQGVLAEVRAIANRGR